MKFDGSYSESIWAVAVTKYCQSLEWAMEETFKSYRANRIVVIKTKNTPKTKVVSRSQSADIEFHDISANVPWNLKPTDKVIARYGYCATSMETEAHNKGFNEMQMKSRYNSFPSSIYGMSQGFTYPDAWIFTPSATKKYQLEVDTVFHLKRSSSSSNSNLNSNSNSNVNNKKQKTANTNFQGWISDQNGASTYMSVSTTSIAYNNGNIDSSNIDSSDIYSFGIDISDATHYVTFNNVLLSVAGSIFGLLFVL